MLFRNLKFINSVLINSEVWHPVDEKDLKALKKADKNLLVKIMDVPSAGAGLLLVRLYLVEVA